MDLTGPTYKGSEVGERKGKGRDEGEKKRGGEEKEKNGEGWVMAAGVGVDATAEV